MQHENGLLNDAVEGRLAEMSLDQKIGQITMGERMTVTPEDVKRFFLGAVLSGGGSHPGQNSVDDWVRMNDEYWQAAVGDEDGFGIPILFGIDAVHGHNNVSGATVFPHNIGLGAARDVDLISRISRATAREILASGVEWNFAPTLAVVQDCRWGRTYESFGNDPELTSAYGAAFVRAHQGEAVRDGVIACVKHWVGDGGTSRGIDQGDTRLSFDELEATHIAPYYPALDSGVLSVMVSFNSWNGEKCHGHRFLVTELLKEKLGFDGIVVSDWDGIDYLDDDYDVAIRLAVNAGIDMFMVPEKWQRFIEGLTRQVEQGHVAEERIDDAVRRVLGVKERYGLFDKPRPAERPRPEREMFGGPEHRDLAREAVRKSLVLMKNENAILPLRPGARVLVAGKNAHNLGHQCGGWTISWQGASGNDAIKGTTVWEGIRSLCPKAVLSEDYSGVEADPAVHDVAVVIIGETPYAEGMGDIRTDAPDDRDDGVMLVEAGSVLHGEMEASQPYARSLRLSQIHPEDLDCIARIAGVGVPVVAVLISGRPLLIEDEYDAAAAFVAAWLPGSEGRGVAEVLFGQADFHGSLPMPWPRIEYKEAASDVDGFPAGFGLRYSAETVHGKT